MFSLSFKITSFEVLWVLQERWASAQTQKGRCAVVLTHITVKGEGKIIPHGTAWDGWCDSIEFGYQDYKPLSFLDAACCKTPRPAARSFQTRPGWPCSNNPPPWGSCKWSSGPSNSGRARTVQEWSKRLVLGCVIPHTHILEYSDTLGTREKLHCKQIFAYSDTFW